MELSQVRYFLALASTLNFTRAAEICCVTQPALTRAIQTLEFEMGGQLITRERRLSHLTELGQRLLPILERTYKEALTAKAMARACTDGGALRLALTSSVDLGRLTAPLGQVISSFPSININVMRGSAEEVFEHLKCGEADVAIADADLGNWERLDSWLVDRVPYSLVVNCSHEFAKRKAVPIASLARQRLISLPHCSLAGGLLDIGLLEGGKGCQVATLGDVFTLLKLNFGVALLPRDIDLPAGLVRAEARGFTLEHSTRLYAVSGRLRAKPAAAFVTYFARASDRMSPCGKAIDHSREQKIQTLPNKALGLSKIPSGPARPDRFSIN